MDFSQITDSIYIGTTPLTEDYRQLRELGVQLVINMRAEQRPHPDLDEPPLPVLWLPSFDTPLLPIPLRHLIKGVLAALRTIEQGGKVYAHCAKGRHRGAAMAAAILIAQGYLPEQAIHIIKQHRKIAQPEAWYIRWRIFGFAKIWTLHQEKLSAVSHQLSA